MTALQSTRESAQALTVCVSDPNERRRILSALIRERATAISYELLAEVESELTTEETPV
jgi:hypothetical protein